MPTTPQHIGNTTLLQRHKVAFLAASHISTLSVLPTLEWAARMARRDDVAVVSGFSSRMEEEVLHVLLRGNCGIILMLGRQHYKILPSIWQKPLADGRLLIISTSRQTRQSRHAAAERNAMACDMADEIVMPCVPPEDSSLRRLYEKYKENLQFTVPFP